MTSFLNGTLRYIAIQGGMKGGRPGPVYHLVTGAIHALTRILCKVHTEALAQVPHQGPVILVANHINFLDAPLYYTSLRPRPLTGFAKTETWDSPLMAFLFDLWGAIPLQRGQADIHALRQGLGALDQGKLLMILPEGTRSGDGRLQRARPGVSLLAQHSGAVMLPMAIYGVESFSDNFRRLRRTEVHFSVGQLWTLTPGLHGTGQQVRQRIADELMYQVAALMPPQYRGVYADLEGVGQPSLIQLAGH
ncbi:MAG TPA: lysophospholipid acyltransferase family protein [Anaerolineales bacterium]|nr:lysophospholipid acyltransferase family protein [Anaerolineales bacterium]